MKKTSRTKNGGAAFRRILVATDFSEGAEWALERAMQLPMANRAKLIIAHVQPDNIPPKYRRAAREECEDLLEKSVRRVLSRYHRIKRTDIRVVPVLRTGPPSVEIVGLARTMMAEILVIGKHGRRRIRDLVIGSTAEKIIREAGLPVLVVNQSPPADRYIRPAIALDLDDAFLPIVTATLRVIGQSDGAITAIHAYDTPFEGFVSYGELDAYRRSCRAEALSKIRDRLGWFGGDLRWDITAQLGDPRAVIVREIAKKRTDLIALGTRGRSRLSHALFGSVVDYVLRSVRCDALVCPPTRRFPVPA